MNKRLKSPLHVQIEITGNCTSNCVHCYNFWRDKNGCRVQNMQGGNLSENDALLILERLGKAEIFSITITGGEPLLNFAVALRCVEVAKSMGMGVGLNSNLVPLTDKKARRLKDAGLNHTLTSILGPTPEIHDRITQRKGSFARLMEGIKVAQKNGIEVAANMVVTQLNWKYIIETAEIVASLGVKTFMATKAGCPGNCYDFSHLGVNQQQLVSFLNDLCWVQEHLGLKVDTLEPIPLCGLRGVVKPELFSVRKCNAGVTTATISYNGSVRPCPHLDIHYGNLLKEGFETIWAKMDPWSQRVFVPVECRGCELLGMCGSGCRMGAKTNSGRIDGLDCFTTPANVPEIAELIRTKRKMPGRRKVRYFRTTMFRLRKENFGGVACFGKNFAFVDENGFVILRQLKPDVMYDLDSLHIDWRGLDPETFISGLLYRQLVLSVSDP